MAVDAFRRGIGQIQSDPLSKAPQPKRKAQRPSASYAPGGVNVVLVPVPGLSDTKAFPGGKSFQFQCAPLNSLPFDGDVSYNDYMTVGDGMHSAPPSGRNLRTVQFDTLFLDWQPDFATLHHPANWVPDPQEFIADLEMIRNAMKPFRLLAHQGNYRARYDIDMAATLRSLHWEIRDEVDAYYVTVSFTEHRSDDLQEFLQGTSKHPALPATLAVKGLPSDRNTMAKLARYYYNDPTDWSVIAAANGITKFPQNEVLTEKNTGRTKITVPVAKSSITTGYQGRH